MQWNSCTQILRHCLSVCLEGLRNTMYNMHNSGCLSRYSSRATSEYKLEALLLQLTCSFQLSYVSWLQKYSTLKHQIYSIHICVTCSYFNLHHYLYLSLLHTIHIHSSFQYCYISKQDCFQWPCPATMFRW